MEVSLETPVFAFSSLTVSPFLSDKQHAEKIKKWGLDKAVAIRMAFDKGVKKHQAPDLIKQFLANEEVKAALSLPAFGPVDKLGYTELGASAISLEFIVKGLAEGGLVRESTGTVVRCLDEDVGNGVIVGDKLRLSLLSEGSEEWMTWSDADRAELVFALFSTLIVGGPLNQYDEETEPYISLTKALYRDMATVQKDQAGNLQVATWHYALTHVSEEGKKPTSLFAREKAGKLNTFLVSVDPIKRRVSAFYHSFIPVW